MDYPLTKNCLKEAINGESTASKKYSEYSKIAEDEGFSNIAYLFLALSEAEKIHIRNHKNALEDNGYEPIIDEFETSNTLNNVKDAINGEEYEYKEMYPLFLNQIKKETKDEFGKVGNLSMEWAKEVENTHAEVLKEALEFLNQGKDFEINILYICRFCGNLVYKLPDKFCPVCKHDKRFYIKVERKGL